MPLAKAVRIRGTIHLLQFDFTSGNIMATINQFASITNNMARISGSIGDLAYNFKEVAERTALDDANIDLLIATAEQLIVQAQALETIPYDPTPEPPIEP